MTRTLSLKSERLAELTTEELAGVHGGARALSLQSCPATVCETLSMFCYSAFCPTEGAA